MLFLLDLASFGRMQIDAYVKDEQLRALFYLDQQDSLKSVNAALPTLHVSLAALGYGEIFLAARLLRELSEEQSNKFAALSLGVPEDVQLLNVKV